MRKELLTAVAHDDGMLLEALIPGRSDVTRKVRAQIRSFAANPVARGALIIGPVGAGKSTIARVIALMRYLHLCPDETRVRIVKYLLFDGPFRIDKRLLNWFEEINLTGLTESLAQAQLFGVAKGGATDVRERAGIFEQAMSGHSSKDAKSVAAKITGGVVLLDEIGDFSPNLQPLLLLLLTGAQVFRVGGEGDPKYGYEYRGVTIGATWKDPFNGTLRYDLLSRLANYVIRIPGLNDRRDEFDEIVRAMLDDIISRHSAYLDELDRESPEAVSRARIKSERGRVLELSQGSMEFLRSQDWSKRGDLRGLRQILERCFYEGVTVQEAVEMLVPWEPKSTAGREDFVLEVVNDICRGDYPTTLAKEMNRVEGRLRDQLAARLKADPSLCQRMAERLNIDDRDLKRQLKGLTRDRARGRNETD